MPTKIAEKKFLRDNERPGIDFRWWCIDRDDDSDNLGEKSATGTKWLPKKKSVGVTLKELVFHTSATSQDQIPWLVWVITQSSSDKANSPR